MEYTAFTKSVQVAPRKVRIVADVVRSQSIDNALATLSFLKKRGASVLENTLRSALANAVSKNASKEALFIKHIEVSGGPAYKRFHPSTRGRIHPYKKRTSHIRIVLSDEGKNIKTKVDVKEPKIKEEKNGTKS